MKPCSVCREEKPLSEFRKHKDYPDGFKSICKECHANETREYKRNLRKACLQLLGIVCKKCGFSDERALQIDHVNGGGYAERLRLNTHQLYQRVLAHPEDYQTLCANCNWIKAFEAKEINKGRANTPTPLKTG